ncbi:hypothetical protein QDT91_29005 (plasmid) [Mycolicibacterium aubagnense]|uniref:hypothetical protein n=1 Tax=Mycolicibacterium aubagnense TaxID=319707 RepID=UPI00244DDF87|nr:hypothetical protein [Mycolicibacterium aubagnense]WGI36042.1 hypothetical protein QDT91_29005 [Mycolicibacterium aubagnense]
MRSKVAVIVSLIFVLAVGGAALAVNTRILNTSPPPDIGRANEVLMPGGAQPAVAPTATPAVAPALTPTVPTSIVSPRNDDERSAGEHSEPEEAEHERDD